MGVKMSQMLVHLDVGFKQDSFVKLFSGQLFFINVWFGQVTVFLYTLRFYTTHTVISNYNYKSVIMIKRFSLSIQYPLDCEGLI